MRVPFRDHGRTRNGCDCWGLVRLVYAEQLGIDLPSYGEISAFDMAAVAGLMDAGKDEPEVWAAVDEPRAFDVVVMRRYGSKYVGHVGVMVDASRVLHVELKADAAIVPITDQLIARRLVGFRRHRNATQDAQTPQTLRAPEPG